MVPRPLNNRQTGAHMTTQQPAFLTPHQLVTRWNGVVTIGTLANWRCRQVGPSYVKLRGRILYRVDQVEAWEAKNNHAANDNAAADKGAA